jgi:hypothetical protein
MLTVKSPDGSSLRLDVDPSTTVAQVKALVGALLHGEPTAAGDGDYLQTLLQSGAGLHLFAKGGEDELLDADPLSSVKGYQGVQGPTPVPCSEPGGGEPRAGLSGELFALEDASVEALLAGTWTFERHTNEEDGTVVDDIEVLVLRSDGRGQYSKSHSAVNDATDSIDSSSTDITGPLLVTPAGVSKNERRLLLRAKPRSGKASADFLAQPESDSGGAAAGAAWRVEAEAGAGQGACIVIEGSGYFSCAVIDDGDLCCHGGGPKDEQHATIPLSQLCARFTRCK